MHRRHLDDQREELSLTAKNENMDVFVSNLAELNSIQSNRLLDIENLDFDYSQKLEKDKQKVADILAERQVVLKNHEHDVQQVLYRMLQHLREVKHLKVQLKHIEYQKRKSKQRELDVIGVYRKRLRQIDSVYNLGQLH